LTGDEIGGKYRYSFAPPDLDGPYRIPRGGDAPLRIHALDVSHLAEPSLARPGLPLEQQPGDVADVRCGGLLDRRPDHRAAIVERLPGRTGAVPADPPTRLVEQVGVRRRQHPFQPVGIVRLGLAHVDLRSHRLRLEEHDMPRRGR
jgi:hypothetical protein